MSITLCTLANNIAGLTLANDYTAGTYGATGFVLSSGGSLFPATPCRMTVIKASTYQSASEIQTIYEVTNVSGNTITCSGAIEGTTDQNFSAGDKVDLRLTAGSVNDLNTVVTPTLASYAATGTTQGTAVAIAAPSFFSTMNYAVITGSTSSAHGAILPVAVSGMPVTVVNTGSYPVSLYPQSGSSILGLTANAPVTIPAGGSVALIGTSSTTWWSDGYAGTQSTFLTGSTTYAVPNGATQLTVYLVGSGGGGGGGGNYGGSNSSGGGGGGGGAAASMTFQVAQTGTSIGVTIGAPGSGGTGETNGTSAATSYFGPSGNPFLVANGGLYGHLGGGGTGSGGVNGVGQFLGSAGGSSSSGAAGGAGGNVSSGALSGGSGGGAGGGVSSTGPTGESGGAGGTIISIAGSNAGGAAGTSGGNGGNGATAGVSAYPATNVPQGGTGGGGGAGNPTGTGGTGGTGGNYGGGGGGGGSGTTGGAGGNGAGGCCLIIAA